MNFDEVVREYAGEVLSLATRISGDVNVAQDVSQEVFLATWRTLGATDDSVNWRAYLYRATVRETLKQVRRRPKVDGTGFASRADSRNATPEEQATLSEFRQALRRCIADLPRKQGMAFSLVKIQGMSYADCARVLDCSEVAVRVHVHKAARRLAEKLSNWAPNRKMTLRQDRRDKK